MLALAILFGTPLTLASLIVGAPVGASYWVVACGAMMFPGTDWTGPEFAAKTPRPFGFHIQQLLGAGLPAVLAVATELAFLSGYDVRYI